MTDTVEQNSKQAEVVTLDAEQEYAWAVEPSRPVFPMLAIEIEGQFARETWDRAFKAVQRRYPLLSARIVKHAGQRPCFVVLPEQTLPFAHAVANDSQTLLGAMGAESSHSFGLGDSYLARLTIHEESSSTYVLFSAHHAICDGYSNVFIVRDLLLAATGHSLSPAFSVLPSVGELLGIESPLPYAKVLDEPLTADCGNSSFPPAQMETLRLEPDAFRPVLERTKKEGATFQGVLIAALYLAGKQQNPEWQSTQVICLSPADLRPLLKLERQPGVLLTTLPSILSPEDQRTFWDLSRGLSGDLQQLKTIENARAGQAHLREIFSREVDPCRSDTIDVSGFRHDLMVTNLGVLDDLLGIPGCRITQAYQSVVSGTSDDAQIVSALTLNGVLFLHHASRHPMKGLLSAAEKVLVDALEQKMSRS